MWFKILGKESWYKDYNFCLSCLLKTTLPIELKLLKKNKSYLSYEDFVKIISNLCEIWRREKLTEFGWNLIFLANFNWLNQMCLTLRVSMIKNSHKRVVKNVKKVIAIAIWFQVVCWKYHWLQSNLSDMWRSFVKTD